MTSLSNSFVWQNMHDYYDKLGVDAWQDEVVPLHITTNKYLVNIYASLIIARINDHLTSQAQATNEPFHIVEIGVGHGKFSFYLLKTLLKSLKTYNLPPHTIKYVMTDISEDSIKSWQNHPALHHYIESGLIDFALYNALNDTSINLIRSGESIGEGSLNKPLFAIGNYLFDTLPHDAFRVENNKLFEAELSVSNDALSSQDKLKACFEKDDYSFNYNYVSPQYYKNNQFLNHILEQYVGEFETASFLVPVGAIHCIQQLQSFTTSGLTFLVADKGDVNTKLFEGLSNPEIAYHGSVSLSVNFDLLARYTKLNNGTPLLMANANASFQVACLNFDNVSPIPHTEYTFKAHLGSFSPQDLFNLCYTEDDEINDGFTTLQEYIALMNLADWDPNLFYDYYPNILDAVENEEITEEQDAALLNGLPKVWDFFFKLERSCDIPFAIGAILYQLDYAEKAIEYFKLSIEHFGNIPETYYNLALAYDFIDDDQNAVHALEAALKIQPDYPDARSMLNEIGELANA